MTSCHGIRIFSLTDNGSNLASSMLHRLPGSRHIHRADDFTSQAQSAFKDGHDCIFICSTGIVIRTLAPVLTDKRNDPAVVVVDDQGRFVIPLLSSHEGGAAMLARQLSELLDAVYVSTSARDYSRPVYAAGMGCERNCPVESLEAILNTALQQIDEPELDALSSIDVKADEAGLLQLAERRGLDLETYPASTLHEKEGQLTEKSEIVFREVGCYGVAEAAALHAASERTGEASELLVTKIKRDGATVAIARSYLQE